MGGKGGSGCWQLSILVVPNWWYRRTFAFSLHFGGPPPWGGVGWEEGEAPLPPGTDGQDGKGRTDRGVGGAKPPRQNKHYRCKYLFTGDGLSLNSDIEMRNSRLVILREVDGQHVLSVHFFFHIFDCWSVVKLTCLCVRSWAALGTYVGALGRSWGLCGRSWPLLGPLWAALGGLRPKSGPNPSRSRPTREPGVRSPRRKFIS